MRILIAGTVGDSLPPPYAGVPKRALLLARFWREAGHEVGVCFTHRQAGSDDLAAGATYFFEFPKRPNRLMKLFFLAQHALKAPGSYIAFVRAYRRVYGFYAREVVMFAAYGIFIDRVMQEFKPDVVLVESALLRSFMAIQAATRHAIPVAVDTYAEMHTASYKSMDRFGSRRAEYWQKFLEPVKIIIAPSDYCAAGPLAYVPAEKVKVIYSGIEVAKYAAGVAGDKRQAREHFHLPQDAFIVMAVGAYTSRKGHDHVIEAVARMPKDAGPIAIVLCGAGDPAWLVALARERGLENRTFVFRGLSEYDLIRLYGAADVYCDASNTPRACLGMSLTEAMSARLPTVAYDIGGLPEVVHHGENGLIVPANDIQALADAILRIKRLTPAERLAMGERGLALAQQLVDITRTSRRLLTELEAITH